MAGVSTSPGWSSNVIGELSSGLLKSATSPATTSETAITLRPKAAKNLTGHHGTRSLIMSFDLTCSETIIARKPAGDDAFACNPSSHLALASSAPAGTLSAGKIRQRAPVGLAIGPLSSV